MRRVASLAIGVMLVLLVPVMVSAQSLAGLGLPWIPSLSGTCAGPGGGCDPGGGAAMCCPAFYVGYEISRGKERRPVTNGQTFSTTAPDGTYGLQTDFSEPGGLWLGVSKFCQFSDKVGVMASGWYLFPTNGEGEESYGIPRAAENRLWTTNRSWGWLDGAFLLGSPCALNLIGGFRWDSYSVRLRDPRAVSAVTRGTTVDEADLQLNSYIPFVGSQICYGGPCCGLLFRAVGFPWVPGTTTYGETGFLGPATRLQYSANYDRGYFLELFSEYSKTFGSFGCMGIFGRWNYLEVRGYASPQVLPQGIAVQDQFGQIRTSWTVGGRFALNFSLPF